MNQSSSIGSIQDNIAQVIKGKNEVIEMAVVCLLARGHLLLEDVPGVGKTTLAGLLARLYASEGRTVLAVDADPDANLASSIGISPEAAAEKGIKSPVAGNADILLAANIESANSLAKSTTYFANLPLAHVIVGGKVPVLIPSRADKKDAKLLSIALGIIMSDWAARNPSFA